MVRHYCVLDFLLIQNLRELDVRVRGGAVPELLSVGRRCGPLEYLEQPLPELGVLVAVDDEVDGRVDGGQQVRDAHHQVQVRRPRALHLHACKCKESKESCARTVCHVTFATLLASDGEGKGVIFPEKFYLPTDEGDKFRQLNVRLLQ